MNYDETIEYISDTKKFGMNFGLQRTKRILFHLGNPHDKIKCIHIAGTNGKGSVTVMLATMLASNGYKVGMFTSPYIEELEEMIQINRVNISHEKFAESITQVSEAVRSTVAEGYEEPTEFEIITCAALLYFYGA